MKTLVGFDGSEGAWDAIELARLLSGVGGDEVQLVNVLTFGGSVPVAYSLAGYGDASEVKQFFAGARAALADLEVTTGTCVSESPARMLTELAEGADVGLIVVGSPHHGPFGRTFLGSVAEKLLHGASVPIAVAPHGYNHTAPDAIELIAVAYDGGAESRLALNHAVAEAEVTGARIRILTVDSPVIPMPGFVGYTPALGVDYETLVEEALTAASSVESEARRLAGSPAIALAEACESDVDLLVAGSRGYGPLGRVFAGSVSSSLICHSPCPVVVVPRARVADTDKTPSAKTADGASTSAASRATGAQRHSG